MDPAQFLPDARDRFSHLLFIAQIRGDLEYLRTPGCKLPGWLGVLCARQIQRGDGGARLRHRPHGRNSDSPSSPGDQDDPAPHRVSLGHSFVAPAVSPPTM